MTLTDNRLDRQWSSRYSRGVDFGLISANDIDSFLRRCSKTAGSTCLDIGCGTGQLTRELFHRGFRVVGVDSSAEAIHRARLRTVVSPKLLEYVHFDAEMSPYHTLPYSSYGLVVSKLVYAFIQDKQAFVARVWSVVDSDGAFVLIVPDVNLVRPGKQGVAADRDDVLSLLREYFHVDYWYQGELIYFFCKKLSD